MATAAPTTGAPTRAPRNHPYPDPAPALDQAGVESLPAIYASVCVGTCLEPEIADGTILAFSKDDLPQTGDFVCVWMKPEAVLPGEHGRYVKRLACALPPRRIWNAGGEAAPIVILEMLNPSRFFRVRLSTVLAIHRVLGACEDAGGGLASLPKRLLPGGAR